MAGIALAALLSACTSRGPDRVYSLPLPAPPSAADWTAAVPLLVEATGGRTSRPSQADATDDGVHKATASCHHGPKIPPVRVALRSFYTAQAVYLHVEWADPTEDLGRTWTWDGASWRAGGEAEDGLGLLWTAEPPGFTCSRSCHLLDWRVAGNRAFADYRMAAPAGADDQDLWVWRAGRGEVGGAAEDARLTADGRQGDGPGELYEANSVHAPGGQHLPFGPGDAPREAPAPEPGARAPGYRRLDSAPPGRLEVAARAERGRGTWRVTLSRARTGTDPEDLRFGPGQEVAFGLALLDGVNRDHLAVPDPVYLVLVDPSSLPRPAPGAGEGVR